MKRYFILFGFLLLVNIAFGNDWSYHKFTAGLTGTNMVPTVSTTAHGKATFYLDPNAPMFNFKLTVSGIENIRSVLVHLGTPGENGPVVINLYPGPEMVGRLHGTVDDGSFTASDFVGPLADLTMDKFLQKIGAGDIYVTVRTDRYPNGELRGQVR